MQPQSKGNTSLP